MHDKQTLAQIANHLLATPAVLTAMLAPLTPAQRRARPAAGAWSMRDVAVHLLISDGGAFAERITFIVEQQGEHLPRFDPQAGIAAHPAADASLAVLLGQLTRQRQTLASWLRGLDPALLARTARLDPHGLFTAWDFVYEWPYHDQAHLAQIGTLLQMQLLPGMGLTMRRALGHEAAEHEFGSGATS